MIFADKEHHAGDFLTQRRRGAEKSLRSLRLCVKNLHFGCAQCPNVGFI